MRIWLFSDWHLEHHDVPESWVTASIPDADICVVPGDMHRGDLAVSFLGEKISPLMPVVYVPGNHDSYNTSMPDVRRDMIAEAKPYPNLHLLDPGVVIIAGVRFIGATLWTDYDLLGDDMRFLVMRDASASLNDHRMILTTSAIEEDGRLWSPADARARHLEELEFIRSEAKQPFEGPTVIVTHHGPHPRSIHPRFQGPGHARLNGAFVSNLEDVILDLKPALWVHGHIHDTVDYTVGDTRVTANPRGYEFRRGAENPVFDPGRVVEV